MRNACCAVVRKKTIITSSAGFCGQNWCNNVPQHRLSNAAALHAGSNSHKNIPAFCRHAAVHMLLRVVALNWRECVWPVVKIFQLLWRRTTEMRLDWTLSLCVRIAAAMLSWHDSGTTNITQITMHPAVFCISISFSNADAGSLNYASAFRIAH